jgi:hypothetical protein
MPWRTNSGALLILDLDRLADALLGATDPPVRGDEARRQVTDHLQPRIAALMAQGMTRAEAVNRLLAEARQDCVRQATSK